MLYTIFISFLAVILTVGVHYEALALLTTVANRLNFVHRLRIVIVIVVSILAHLLEVGLFSVFYIVMVSNGMGSISMESATFSDYYYFSLVTFTSLGFGDIVPSGPMKLIAGVESLTGLVLIAWTASFTFLQMRRYWNNV